MAAQLALWSYPQTLVMMVRYGLEFQLNLCSSCCLDPYGLVITGTTSNSVDLSWTAGPNAGSYTIEYGTSGFTQGSGSTATSTTTTATISGLTSYTMYDFYVQSDCQASGNGTSNFAGPISVSTCPGAAPYLETFDPGMAPCWIQDQNDIFDWTLNAVLQPQIQLDLVMT